MSVLHVSTEKGWRGGEQQVKLITDGLLARGNKVKVMSPPGAALLEDRQAAGVGVGVGLTAVAGVALASGVAIVAGTGVEVCVKPLRGDGAGEASGFADSTGAA